MGGPGILRWSPDAWDFGSGEVLLGNPRTYSFIQHALTGGLWHTQACVRCQRDVRDEVSPPSEELNLVYQERRER